MDKNDIIVELAEMLVKINKEASDTRAEYNHLSKIYDELSDSRSEYNKKFATWIIEEAVKEFKFFLDTIEMGKKKEIYSRDFENQLNSRIHTITEDACAIY